MVSFLEATKPGGWGGGLLQISCDRDDGRIFLGVKVSIPAFFVVMWQVLFWVA